MKKPFYESEIALEIERAIGRNVDVRVVNGAPIRFINQVLKYGKLIFAKDDKQRVKFETMAIDKYLDFKPFLSEYDRMRNKRWGL